MWGYVAGTASGGAWESLGNTLIVDGPTTVGGLGKFENTFIASSGHVNVIGDRWAKFDNGNDFSLKLQNVHNDGALTFYNIPYDGMAHSLIGLDQNAGEIRGTYTGKGYIGLDARIRPDAGSFDADRIVFTNPQAQRIRLNILPTSDSIQAVNNPVRIGTFSSGATDNPFTTVDPGLGVYAYSILRSGNDYYLALTEDYAAELGQVYSEAAAAVLDQISRTPDLLLRNALNASIEKTNGKGFGMFAVGSYGKERIDTGSHVDVEGIDMLAALAYNRGTPWSVGLFTEYFTGEYNTRNTATTSLDTFTIKSDGDIESVGGGLFVQFRPGEGQVNGIPLGWRFDASARMGVNKMDFGNHTFYDSKFDKSSLYYGTTLGGAYVFTPTESSTLELYSHGIWTRQLGSSVTDDINQRIDFHHADSLRLVAGGRFDFEAHEKVRPFAGIALDWETMGKPEVDIDGFRAKTADLSGASGVAELGMFITIRDGLGLNTKGTATVGKKEGFGGVVQLQYEF